MAEVRAFKGLRFNRDIVDDLSNVISPPFDTISPELQKALYQRNAYNVVRLEAGERLATDTPQDNRYTRAAALLSEWIDSSVLVRDEEPTFYLVQHTFSFGDMERSRLELMACIRLEEYDRRVVLPHEDTRDEDKRDRLALMEACGANLSPIMCLYRDGEKRLLPIFHRILDGPPLMDFSDPGRQGYRVWGVWDRSLTSEISGALSSSPLYIADGHHRYETALRYRGLSAARRGGVQTGSEGFNFVMMGLIDFDDPGLVVLPYHRVVGNMSDGVLEQVRQRLGGLFDMEPFPGSGPMRLEALADEIEGRGQDQLAMGLLDPAGRDRLQILTLKHGVDVESWGPIGRAEPWILGEQVLKPILEEFLERCLSYTHDSYEAEQMVMRGGHQLGFFLKPFALDLFETIVREGRRLPPKSTYFYPKLPTGLVINLLGGMV